MPDTHEPDDVLKLLDALSRPHDPKHSRDDLAKVILSLRETETFAHLKVHRCEILVEDMSKLLRMVLDAAKAPFPISEYKLPLPVHPHAATWDDIEGNLLPPEMKLLDAIPHVLNRAYDWKMAHGTTSKATCCHQR
jgi:hypothetical protein